MTEHITASCFTAKEKQMYVFRKICMLLPESKQPAKECQQISEHLGSAEKTIPSEMLKRDDYSCHAETEMGSLFPVWRAKCIKNVTSSSHGKMQLNLLLTIS